MKGKHTQEEWVLGLYPNKAYPHRVIMTKDGVAICDVLEKPSLKEMDANAKLIEAAPNLLSSLIRCVDRLEENGFGDMFAVRKAKEVIKQATS